MSTTTWRDAICPRCNNPFRYAGAEPDSNMQCSLYDNQNLIDMYIGRIIRNLPDGSSVHKRPQKTNLSYMVSAPHPYGKLSEYGDDLLELLARMRDTVRVWRNRE